MIIKMNNFITKIRLLEIQITNKYFFEKNFEILKFLFDSENDEKLNTEKIITFNEKKNYELIKILKITYSFNCITTSLAKIC